VGGTSLVSARTYFLVPFRYMLVNDREVSVHLAQWLQNGGPVWCILSDCKVRHNDGMM